MKKEMITQQQYATLKDLVAEMPLTAEAEVRETTGDNFRQAQFYCEDLIDQMEELRDGMDEFEYAIYGRDIALAIDKMATTVHRMKEIQTDVATLANYITGAVVKLLDTVEPSSFVVTASEEEIQQAIDEYLVGETGMSIGYRNGDFALCFGKDGAEHYEEVFFFAKGQEEDYEEARCFIETFLDLEEEDD